jgi:dTDP-4-dehydrorhamnose reductase
MKTRRVVVIGANGQLGTDLMRVLSDWNPIPFTHSDLDICDFNRAHEMLTSARPEIVINTAAFNRVDDCEEEVSKAFSVNTFAARNVARVCAELDTTLMHISTDYVFGGEKRTPYTEEDMPNPLSAYGVSKLAGEHFVRAICPKHFVVRTSGLYGVAGSSGKGGNFVETMIRLAKAGRPIRVVNDQVLTPTYTRDLADKIAELLQATAYGLYHITNCGQCSWYEFAQSIFELTELEPVIESTTSAALGASTHRPAYSVLACSKLEQFGFGHLRSWVQALESYLEEKGYTD